MRLLIMAFVCLLSIKTEAKEVGSPKAKPGGTFFLNLDVEPDTLNPISAVSGYTSQVTEWVLEPLLQQHPDTYEMMPGLAEKWDVSKDGLTFTFKLRKGVTFSDGQPVTSADVRFSFECLMDPRYKAPHRRVYVEGIARIETPDAHTIKFVMKRKYFKNLEVLGGFIRILPKHVYEDPSKSFNKVLVGTGPYKLGTYDTGKSLELLRNENWWAAKTKTPLTANKAKFDKIVYRFIKEDGMKLEMLKTGQLDMLDRLEPDVFVQKAVHEPFDTKIVMHKEVNQDPVNKLYNFIQWNLRNPLFKDRNVRIALAELMNRSLMNEKFHFNLSDLAAGPSWKNELTIDPTVKPRAFNPKHAAELLARAGWEDKEKTGVLQKEIDGKKTEFRFTVIFAKRDLEKYFTVYKEDLKKAGIEMEVKFLEWNVFAKLLGEQKFDAAAFAWSLGSLEPDLKEVFHSESAQLGGSNYGGYMNPEVDKLIDQVREEMDKNKRRQLWRKIYRLIAEDAPAAYMFATKYDLYAIWNHVGMTKGTFKYDRGQSWWWRIQ